ncbi:heme-binding protein [Fodinicurvata sp. EGI_FJ10296]|uniref:GlcG/HbpS family heme-binding protein n=1 Tax=Fodinicurvata sp. EGI_FJ10296 TaxID=3231908 RepID=UPI003451B1A5
MSDLSLDQARTIVSRALAHGRELKLKPLSVIMLDSRGALKAAESEDGVSLKRAEIAHGKAYGALALGMGSRALDKRAQDQAYFMSAVSHVVGGSMVPVPGGVLVRDEAGRLLGAVGISGDLSDNDEAAAVAGIEAAGLRADTGA